MTSSPNVSVWRAAQQIPDTDLRPTGPPQLDKAPALYQRHLREQIAGNTEPAITEWGPLLHDLSPAARATLSRPSWPTGSPGSPAPASTPPTCSAPRPAPARCPMTTPPPRCGGASALTSPPP